MMKNEKTQTQRILDGFVTAVIIIFGVTLVASGMAISKINTDYLETGVRAGKIVAEREAQQIFVTTHEGMMFESENNAESVIEFLLYFPPPVNTSYMIAKEISELLNENDFRWE